VPGYEMRGWNAMVAPRGTPRAVIERLNSEIAATIKSPEARERLAAQGYEPEASTPQHLSDMLKSELVRYGKLVKAVGMTAE
jgi:tripartite-type tricarboxylate transporter receptor subunit TctC